MARKKYPTVTLPKDIHEKLVKYAQSKKLPMSVINADFIEKGIKHDIFDPDWENKMLAEVERVNAYAGLDDACDALAFGVNGKGEKRYRCIIFRVNKPPQITNLGDTESLQNSACASCGKTENMVMGLKERDVRIAELETELGEKSSEQFKIPKCNAGADLRHDKEDQLVFHNCRKHSHEPVSVDKFCKVYSNGTPCAMFAMLTVGVGS